MPWNCLCAMDSYDCMQLTSVTCHISLHPVKMVPYSFTIASALMTKAQVICALKGKQPGFLFL